MEVSLIASMASSLVQPAGLELINAKRSHESRKMKKVEFLPLLALSLMMKLLEKESEE